MLKDLLRTTDLSARDITDLIELATNIETGGTRPPFSNAMAGEMLVLYLTEPAPETRRTYTTAAQLLGASVVVLGPDEFQQGCGATVAGIARALDLYASIVVAVTDDIDLRRLAAATTVPVIDGRRGDDDFCARLAHILIRRDHCPSLDRPHTALPQTETINLTAPATTPPATMADHADCPATSRFGDLAGLIGLARTAYDHRVLYGPTGSSVLTAVDQRPARTPVRAAPATTCACTCSPVDDRARHQAHAVASILLALHRRQLTGASGAGGRL